jgi:hypothetical protein
MARNRLGVLCCDSGACAVKDEDLMVSQRKQKLRPLNIALARRRDIAEKVHDVTKIVIIDISHCYLP